MRRARVVPLSILSKLGFGDCQIVQEAAGRLRIITRPGAVDAGAFEALQEQLRTFFDEPVDVVLEQTGSFVISPSGKRQPVVQRLSS